MASPKTINRIALAPHKLSSLFTQSPSSPTHSLPLTHLRFSAILAQRNYFLFYFILFFFSISLDFCFRCGLCTIFTDFVRSCASSANASTLLACCYCAINYPLTALSMRAGYCTYKLYSTVAVADAGQEVNAEK